MINMIYCPLDYLKTYKYVNVCNKSSKKKNKKITWLRNSSNGLNVFVIDWIEKLQKKKMILISIN